jgi:hypothetical protein
MRPTLRDFKKSLPIKRCYGTADRRWHTDIEQRSLVWKILSGARLSRREEALPVRCRALL